MVPNEPSDRVIDIDASEFESRSMYKAKKDITCYKVVRCRKMGPTTTYSMAIGNVEIPEPVIQESYNMLQAIDKPKITVNCREYPNLRMKVERGYISSFGNKGDAEKYAEYLRKVHNFKRLIVFECKITKGSDYIEGVNEFGDKSYISKILSFVRDVSEE